MTWAEVPCPSLKGTARSQWRGPRPLTVRGLLAPVDFTFHPPRCSGRTPLPGLERNVRSLSIGAYPRRKGTQRSTDPFINFVCFHQVDTPNQARNCQRLRL